MNLELLRDEIWQQLGEPSDLDPDTDTQYSSGPLLTWVVNEGQRQVAFFKDKQTGRSLRFRELYGDMFFDSYVVEDDTLDEDGLSTTQFTLPGDYGAEADRWNGSIIEVGGEKRIVVDYSADRLVTVHKALGVAPSVDDEFSMYKSEYLLLPSTHGWVGENIALPSEAQYISVGNFFHPLKITDMEDEVELDLGNKSTLYLDRTAVGAPTEWYMFGKKIIFNTAPEDNRWFKMEYYRAPYNLSADADEPEIPEPFHYAIVLWGIWWGLRRQQAPTEAWQAWNNLVEFIRFSVEVNEIADERLDDYGRLRLK